jgi:choline dehydrogenase-like flavoprotein
MHDEAAAAAMPSAGLTPHARRVLDALCDALLGDDIDTTMVTRAIEARLAPEHHVRARVERLLRTLDRPLAGRVLGGKGRTFSALPRNECERWLRQLETTSSPMRYAAFEGLRRLVLSTAYAQPQVARAIGWRGPLHLRPPEFPWEGTLPGSPAADEPVARRVERTAPAFSPAPSPPPPPAAAGIVQGHRLGARTSLRADVCVIGSGAGGAVAAAGLALAGRDVVILEEGGYWDAPDFTESEDVMLSRLYADAGLRATTDVGISLLQGLCVGGGTTVNWLLMLRPPRWVMEQWLDAGAELLGPAVLEPALARIEDAVHASVVPDDAHSPSNRVILDASARLGWKASRGRINTRECVRAGTCGLGCRYGARQGALAVWLPLALAHGARLFSDARAARIRRARSRPVAPGGSPTPAPWLVEADVLDRATRSPRGTIAVEAATVVLAAGAVGTPVLLQRSGFGGGAIGRFLRLHPTSAVLGLYPEPMYAAAGIPQSAVCDEFLEAAGGFGFWIECPPLYPGIGAAALPGFGPAHRATLREFPRFAPLIVLVRDGADPAASQGSVYAGPGGAARIRYRMGLHERRTLAEGIHAAARMHFAAGAESVITLHTRAPRFARDGDIDWILRASTARTRVGLFSAHVNGTCRMGPDPRTSGCSPDAQLHGAPGLFIADGSILPSAPGANPQELIMAIGLVVAENIVG